MNHQKGLFFICFTIILCDLYQINAYGVDDNEIGDFDEPIISEYFEQFLWREKFLLFIRSFAMKFRTVVNEF